MFDTGASAEIFPIRNLCSYALNKSKEVLTAVYDLSGKSLQLFVEDAIDYFQSTFLDFDNFQTKILRILLVILFLNIFLVIVLWNVFKDQIYERFIQPSSACIIEELRKSVSQLKLPKKHSPRV